MSEALPARTDPCRPAGRRRRAQPPSAEPNFAYFLDLDGTLFDIAAHPDAVAPDEGLRRLIDQLHGACDGAVALVSGRRIDDLDRFFDGAAFPAAGLHGLERRDAHGRRHDGRPAGELPGLLRERLAALCATYPGLWFEDKSAALALHYRQRPALAAWLSRLLHRWLAPLPQLTLLRGKCVLEIRPRGYDKGRAVAEFMAEAPFAGRRPVFIGDDVTDEDGFAEVNRRGGLSIKVGHGRTGARARLYGVGEVRRWLAACLGDDAGLGARA